MENVFREDDNPRPFKYEFPSQASLDTPTYSASNDDDEAHLTSDTPARKREIDSPMRRRTTLQRVSRNLRRISVRVVNLGSAGIDDRHTRLPDDLDEDAPPPITPVVARQQSAGPLRGTTLGLLGRDNPIRLTMYNILMYP